MIRLVVVSILLASFTASAGPLAQRWREVGCPEQGLVRTEGELVFTDRKAKTIVRRDLATGKLKPAINIGVPGKITNIQHAIGDTFIVAGASMWFGVEMTTGKLRWKVKSPTAATPLEGDLAIARAGKGKGKATVQRLAGKTGAVGWTVDIPARGRIARLLASPTYVVVETTDEKASATAISVLDAKTGSTTWTTQLPFVSKGIFVDNATVVIGESTQSSAATAFHIHALATGKLVGKVEYKNAFAPFVGGGRLFVGTNDLDNRTGHVTAIDTRTAKQLWNVTTPGMFEWLYGLGAGGLVANTGAKGLRVLDVTNGKILASYGAPGIGQVGIAEQSPVITLCDDKELVVLGPGGATETAKVAGTVTCENCDATRFPIRIGDVTGTTNDKGQFTLTLTGTGRYRLEVLLEEQGQNVDFESKFVQLTGKGSYDLGTIKAKVGPLGD